MRKESLVAQPQHPHKPPPKHLQPADLPDPLGDSRDVPMASADDLLSEIVGDDVERLMSGEFDPIVTPGHRAVEQLQHQIGKFLDEVRQREQPVVPAPRSIPAPAPAPAAAPAAASPSVALSLRDTQFDEDVSSPLEDLVGPTREQLVGLHSGEYESLDVAAARGPAESRALLAPVDESANESALLQPLNWMSDPIAHMSARSRVTVSMLAVLSFFGSCAALGYVLLLRHGGV
jgi:hypothetical protein